MVLPALAQDYTPDPAAKPGGSITVTYKDDVATLDPAIGYDWQNWSMIKSLFDGLNIAYDEIEKRSYVVRTALTYGFTVALLVFLTAVSAILVAALVFGSVLVTILVFRASIVPDRWGRSVAYGATDGTTSARVKAGASSRR